MTASGLIRAFLWTMLRGAVLLGCTLLCAFAVAYADSLVPHPPAANLTESFARLGWALGIGGMAGFAIGFAFAVRLGRRRYARKTRLLQTGAALTLFALYVIGSAMEQAP